MLLSLIRFTHPHGWLQERRERIEAQRRERAHQESQRLQAARQRRKTQAADRIARLQQKDEERRRRVAEHEHRRLSTRRTSRPMSADSDSGPLRLAAIFDVDGSLNIPTRNEESVARTPISLFPCLAACLTLVSGSAHAKS